MRTLIPSCIVALSLAACGHTNPRTLAHDLTLDLGNGVTMQLVLIQPGTFTMGSPVSEPGHDGDEVQHEVTIDKPFYMGINPVTIEQFGQLLKSSWYAPKDFAWPKGHAPAGDLPVCFASWDDAEAFCKWLSHQSGRTVALPTHEQWEYACRAGTTTAFFFGADPSTVGDYAWCAINSHGLYHPVGQKKPNPWGLYDMVGNVEEWTGSYYPVYKKGPDDLDVDGHRVRDFKVICGASAIEGPWGCRSAPFGRDLHNTRFGGQGFRVVVLP